LKAVTRGTYEKGWAGPKGETMNICKGCEDLCEYCYGRNSAARRGQKDWDDWGNTRINWKIVNKGYRKQRRRVMFPSTHNINKYNLKPSIIFLNNLLPHVKSLLIVIKPWYPVVKKLCKQFQRFNDKIELRFTITTFQDRWRERFEPYSSPIPERLSSIKLAHKYGFLVSVVVEPFLDADPLVLIRKLIKRNVGPHNIWIGPMNHRRELSRTSDVIFNHSAYLNSIYQPLNLKSIYGRIMAEGWKINFKDGFLNQMRKK